MTRFRTQKTALLAAYLASHARDHSRDELIELLWPEAEPKAGRNSLSVALASLRGQLEPPGVAAGTVILADRAWVRMNPDSFTSDLADFRRAVGRAHAASSPTERRQALHDAVEAYQGPFLDGFYDDWVLHERRVLVAEFLDAADALSDLLEADGDVDGALRLGSRAAEADPLRETTCARLMRLLAASDRAEAALALFAEFRGRLEEQVGLEPGEALWALAESIAARAEEAANRPVSAPPSLGPAGTPHGGPPQGTVTFLMLDFPEAPERAEGCPSAAGVLTLIRRHGGHELSDSGGSRTAAFGRCSDAVRCAIDLQHQLAGADHQARMAIHTGEVGDSADGPGASGGPVAQHCRRLLAATHAGQILATEAPATLLRRETEQPFWLTDLGRYRLEGEARPQTIFQVGYDGMQTATFPPPKAETGHAASLPLRLSRFFGREQELSRIDGLILDERARLVTVTGPGGIGKTRLVLEAAKRLVGSFRGAVWFVELAEVSRPEALLEAVRDALRIDSRAGVDDFAAVVDLLRRQPCLLVLDNLEQVVEAGIDVIVELLRHVPGLTCLASSRHLLGIDGECELILSPLPLPVSIGSVDSLLRFESVELFVDRALGARPDFRLTEANRDDVVALCSRLEGIPLALELAAARTNVLAPGQLLQRLSAAFDLLASKRRDVPDRHRTLRATFDWSYDLLSPELRRFLLRLSIFRGGWTLEAAEAVCDEPLAIDYLAQLKECSLVGLVDHGDYRYQALETIRYFAWDRLTEQDDGQALGQRHFEYYRDLAARMAAGLNEGATDPLPKAFDDELQNFRLAFDWALESDVVGAYEFAGHLWRYWAIRGHWTEAREALTRLLDRRDGVPPAAQARALGWAGNIAFRQADYPQARRWLEECLALATDAGEPETRGNALNELGKVAWAQSDWATAQECFERALALRREAGNPWSIAAALSSLGSVAAAYGQWDLARGHLEESLALRRGLNDQRGIAMSLNAAGVVAYGQRDLAAARAYQEECFERQRALGDRAGMAAALSDLGVLAAAAGDHATARGYHEEALEHRIAVGDKRGTAGSLNNLGAACRALGEHLAAQQHYQRSIALRRQIGDKRGLALSLNNLGDALLERGDSEAARACFLEGLQLQREIGDRVGEALSLNNLGEAALADGDPTAARDWYERCLEAAVHQHDTWLSAAALRGLGNTVASSCPAESELFYQISLKLYRDNGDRPGMVQVIDALAQMECALGRPAVAARLAGAAEALRAQRHGQRGSGEEEEAGQRQLRQTLEEQLGERQCAAEWARGAVLAADEPALADLAAHGWPRDGERREAAS